MPPFAADISIFPPGSFSSGSDGTHWYTCKGKHLWAHRTTFEKTKEYIVCRDCMEIEGNDGKLVEFRQST